MPTLFFTGFPGFLGVELLPRALARAEGSEAVCLVQPRFMAAAVERARSIEAASAELRGRIRVVPGDITRPDLGVDSTGVPRGNVTQIYHLAAVYDLSVRRELALRVNVQGTRHVLALARRCPRLERFHYVSTCYVSGRHAGPFGEDDLDVGQGFNNAYEESKFLAEVEVQRAMGDGLPATVYRPAIVVGDSLTGATQKYDGPYFAIRWLLRQPRLAVMPVVGDPAHTELNVVPRDFVVSAITRLGARADAAGAVYHLADPEPLSIDAMLGELARATGRRVLRVPLPLGAAKAAIDHLPGVYRLMRIPSSAIDYFVHPTRYTTARTRPALADADLRVPRFPEYVDRLVNFVRAHPHIGSAAMA